MTSRRQNSSCDECRRSKRRCVLQQELSHQSDKTCLNCFSFGYKCTFEFVKARTQQRRRKKVQPEARLLPAERPYQSQPQLVPVSCNDEVVSEDLTRAEGGIDTDRLFEMDFSQCVSADSGSPYNADGETIISVGEIADQSVAPLVARPYNSPSLTRLCPNDGQLSGFWSGSPVKLLNSKLTATVLGACLDDTYNSMMHGMESRYLANACNPFASSHKYCFESEDEFTCLIDQGKFDVAADLFSNLSASNRTTKIFASLPTSPTSFDCTNVPASPQSSAPGIAKITMDGLVRFLDHFGTLYGNRLDRQTRKEDEDTLIAAQRAFALQWSPSDKPGTEPLFAASADTRRPSTNNYQIFATAWFEVRTRITRAEPHSSFMRVYAMLLFHMTNTPEEASNATKERSDIFDQCLRQFMSLKDLVETYCMQLDITSIYRTRLESSVKVLQWFAYIKDTMASIVSERDFILSEAPLKSPHVTYPSSHSNVVGWMNQYLDDAEIPLICQKAVSVIFQLLRQIVRVKGILHANGPMCDPSRLSDALDVSVSIVESFYSSYGQFCDQCTCNFPTLSESSRLSSGYLILFWNLGVLSCVEQVQAAYIRGLLTGQCYALSRAYEFENIATASVVAIAKQITNASVNGHYKVSDNSAIKLPFISHHANPAPIIAVLMKTIEHIVQRHTSNAGAHKGTTPFGTESWMPSIKSLLSCLLDFDSTVAGSQITRSAVRKLMASHSDIIMDCWTVDEPELLINWTERAYGQGFGTLY